MKRTWSLLSTSERVKLVGQCSGVVSLNAALPALATYSVGKLQGSDVRPWLVALALAAVLLLAAGLGLVWFFARPGSRAWRRG